MRLIAIDPGKDKCGLAILEGEKVILKKLFSPSWLYADLGKLVKDYEVKKIILGDRTFSRETEKRIKEILGEEFSVIKVDEHLSTQEAREKYFAENPPRGWKRFLPLTMQTPPEPYDHYVAVILAQRYLKQKMTIKK